MISLTPLFKSAARAAALLAFCLGSSSALASATQGALNPACPQFAAYGYPQPMDAKVARRSFHLCKLAFSSYFDPATRAPRWVAERLRGNVHGGEPRTNDFRADPDLPAGVSPSNSDYARSGFDKGHMAPAEDFSLDPAAMSESFLFSNMIPQHPDSNRIAWKQLEMMTRDWAKARGEVYVISGPIYAQGQALALIGAGKVAAPTHIFKIVIDPARGESIAFALPNAKIQTDAPEGGRSAKGAWKKALAPYIVSVGDIAAWTGFDFNPALNPADKARFNAAKSGMWNQR